MADNDDEAPVDGPQRAERPARRMQSQTDRDHEGFKARKERELAAGFAQSIPVELPEDITGQYEGEERKMYRNKRPTDERVERLEDKHDKLDDKIDKLEDSHSELVTTVNRVDSSLAELRGEMKVLPRLVTALEKAAETRATHETMTLTTKLDVDRQQALEPIKAKEARRGWITTGIAIVASVVAAILAIMKARG